MIQQGIDIILYINNQPVAGQQNATLNQSMSAIDITNKINGDWAEKLSGLRTWNITCGGMYVLSSDALDGLEEAFMSNTELDIAIILGEKKFVGKVLITDFPLSAVYNSQFKYNLHLLGTGALSLVDA